MTGDRCGECTMEWYAELLSGDEKRPGLFSCGLADQARFPGDGDRSTTGDDILELSVLAAKISVR